MAKLDASRHPEEIAADIIEVWSSVETALRSLMGGSTLSGQPLIRGRYAAQWIKRDGRWLIRAEVFVALGCANAGCSRAVTVQ